MIIEILRSSSLFSSTKSVSFVEEKQVVEQEKLLWVPPKEMTCKVPSFCAWPYTLEVLRARTAKQWLGPCSVLDAV